MHLSCKACNVARLSTRHILRSLNASAAESSSGIEHSTPYPYFCGDACVLVFSTAALHNRDQGPRSPSVRVPDWAQAKVIFSLGRPQLQRYRSASVLQLCSCGVLQLNDGEIPLHTVAADDHGLLTGSLVWTRACPPPSSIRRIQAFSVWSSSIIASVASSEDQRRAAFSRKMRIRSRHV